MSVNYIKETWKILVVDDVELHRSLMVRGLRRINPFLKIFEAGDPDEAITTLSEGRWDAVVSDWNMPGGGGEALLKWMRARPHFRNVPFIMISGNTESEDIIKAFMELSVDAYVVKPFTPKNLYNKIKQAIDGFRK